jgi:hypothetical protein
MNQPLVPMQDLMVWTFRGQLLLIIISVSWAILATVPVAEIAPQVIIISI